MCHRYNGKAKHKLPQFNYVKEAFKSCEYCDEVYSQVHVTTIDAEEVIAHFSSSYCQGYQSFRFCPAVQKKKDRYPCMVISMF